MYVLAQRSTNTLHLNRPRSVDTLQTQHTHGEPSGGWEIGEQDSPSHPAVHQPVDPLPPSGHSFLAFSRDMGPIMVSIVGRRVIKG